MEIRERFGAIIKAKRLEKKLSQEALAHLSKLDRTYIPSIENGKRNVSIETIQKLANALQCSICELLHEIDL